MVKSIHSKFEGLKDNVFCIESVQLGISLYSPNMIFQYTSIFKSIKENLVKSNQEEFQGTSETPKKQEFVFNIIYEIQVNEYITHGIDIPPNNHLKRLGGQKSSMCQQDMKSLPFNLLTGLLDWDQTHQDISSSKMKSNQQVSVPLRGKIGKQRGTNIPF